MNLTFIFAQLYLLISYVFYNIICWFQLTTKTTAMPQRVEKFLFSFRGWLFSLRCHSAYWFALRWVITSHQFFISAKTCLWKKAKISRSRHAYLYQWFFCCCAQRFSTWIIYGFKKKKLLTKKKFYSWCERQYAKIVHPSTHTSWWCLWNFFAELWKNVKLQNPSIEYFFTAFLPISGHNLIQASELSFYSDVEVKLWIHISFNFRGILFKV